MTIVRAIYAGMGIADDPDVDDYYTKARGFPITYSSEDDPEVIEEMRIAAAELKKGSDDSENEAMEASGEQSSSEDETSSDEVGEGAGEDWVDEPDSEDADESGGAPKRKQKKILTSVDKVRALSIIIFVFDQNTPPATCNRCRYPPI
jgi:hypothetical protein